MKLNLVLVGLLILISFYPLEAATYYISLDGNDQNSGTSEEDAWASVARVNETTFSAGDKILFEGGSTFEGGMFFGPESGGTFTNPVYIGSYGKGRATILSGNSFGLKVYNTAGFRIRNLVFTGSGLVTNRASGIEFYMDLPSTTLDYIEIDRVEVSGYRESGIRIGSWNGRSGFNDVAITHCRVHDNGDAGISTYAQADDLKKTILGHKNVYIGHTKAYNNSGIPEKTHSHSGNGIVLGSVDGALIEYCEAYNNGWLNAWKEGGPVGIWGWQCNNLVIQYNESHHNKTGTGKDGGGFDIDGGSTNSVMQYNYSHDNEGPGYLLAQYYHAPPMKGITVRYNISENDARKNSYGAIHVWSSGSNGGIQDLDIYNNTVYLTPSAQGTPRAIFLQSGGLRNARILNNIFQTTGGLEMVFVDKSTDVRFEGNNYWPTEAGNKFRWLGKPYTSLEGWQNASGQEMRDDIRKGLVIDPQFKSPGRGVQFEDQQSLYLLDGYELGESSTLQVKGIDLKKEYGIDAGKFDFWGNSIEERTDLSVGAHQPTNNSLACLQGGPVYLAFGPESSGTYEGRGVEGGKFFNPEGAGPDNHALRFRYTDSQGNEQSLAHTVRVVDATSTVWTGQGITNSWSDHQNWSTCVPTYLIDVEIPATEQPAPRLKSGEQGQLNNLLLNSLLEIEENASLEINGAVSGENIKIVADPQSIIVFNNNDSQAIPAATYGTLQLEGSGIKSLRDNVSVQKKLVMGQSNLLLGDYNLSLPVEALILNASAGSYLVTNGKGRLIRAQEGGHPIEFPIGSRRSFSPVWLRNMGAPDSFGVRVEEESELAAASPTENMKLRQNMVPTIWHIDEATEGGSDIELKLQWNEWDEPAAFLHTNSYISQFVASAWSRAMEAAVEPEEGSEAWSFRLTLGQLQTLGAFAIGSEEHTPTSLASASAAGLGAGKRMLCYPNPFAEQLFIEVDARTGDQLVLNMTTLNGKTVMQKTLPLQAGLNRLMVPMDDTYPAGLYLLTARFGSQVSQTKIKKY